MLIIEVRRKGERNMRPFAFIWKVQAQPVASVHQMPRDYYDGHANEPAVVPADEPPAATAVDRGQIAYEAWRATLLKTSRIAPILASPWDELGRNERQFWRETADQLQKRSAQTAT